MILNDSGNTYIPRSISGRKEIRLLDNLLINKIAAGEVVERPLSIVKELVENSIDAGASMIAIEITGGGIDFIRVTDNGVGIPANEVRTAFTRHATSKLSDASDLENILTLGFRGEALPSIAAVSRVEMITRAASATMGRMIEIDGGEIKAERDIGAVQGTTFIVRNLFHNIPARHKFLKKPATEGGYITELVGKLALGNTGIVFKYINNNILSLQTKGDNDLRTVIAQVYGREISGKMLDLNGKSDDGLIRVSGCVGKPEISRANRTYGNLFINSRYIKNDRIRAAIEDAYRTRLMNGRFPVYIIHIEIDTGAVDVNVHPAKTEVRFSDEDGLCELVRDTIINTLKDNVLIPEVKLQPARTFASEIKKQDGNQSYQVYQADEKQSPVVGLYHKQSKPPKYLQDVQTGGVGDMAERAAGKAEHIPEIFPESAKDIPIKFHETKDTHIKSPQAAKESSSILYVAEPRIASKGYLAEPIEHSKHPEPIEHLEHTEPIKYAEPMKSKDGYIEDYRIVGIILNTYVLVERGESLLIFDQHAAHERILYEEIISKMDAPIAGQTLLSPIVVRVSDNEKRAALENTEVFMDMGLEIEDFGENNIAIRSLPFITGGQVKPDFFIEVLDRLDYLDKGADALLSKRELIASAACKAAVKAGDKLSDDEIRAMIDTILCMENPFSCPHGRPTIIELTCRELEKRFKRI